MQDFEEIKFSLKRKQTRLLKKASKREIKVSPYYATPLENFGLLRREKIGEPINGTQIYANRYYITDKGCLYLKWRKHERRQPGRLWSIIGAFIAGVASTVIGTLLLELIRSQALQQG